MNTRVILKLDGTPDRRYKNWDRNGLNVRRNVPKPQKWRYNVASRGNTISLTFTRDGVSKEYYNLNQSGRLDVSCGVTQIAGVSALNHAWQIGCPAETVEAGIRELLREAKSPFNVAVLSNNNNTPRINAFLDRICKVSSPYERNHNSGNQIKVWVI